MFTLMSIFMTACVAINLQVVFLGGHHNTQYLEKWYYIGAVVLSTVISGSGLLAGQYGWDPLQENCWFNADGTPVSTAWQWWTMYTWLALVVLYCLTIIGFVLRHISRGVDRLNAASAMSGGGGDTQSSIITVTGTSPPVLPTVSTTERGSLGNLTSVVTTVSLKKRKRQNLMRILKRVILYPLVPVITQTPNLIVTMQALALGYNTYFIVWLSFFCNSIQGALNCIVFFMDPAVRAGIANYIRQRREKKLREQEMAKAATTDRPEKTPAPVYAGAPTPKWTHKSSAGALDSAAAPGDAAADTSVISQDHLGVQIESGKFGPGEDDEAQESWFKLL